MGKSDMHVNANNLQMIFSSTCISPLWPQQYHCGERVRQRRQNGQQNVFLRICHSSLTPYTSKSGQICLQFQGQSTVKRPQQPGSPTSSCRLYLGMDAFAISQFKYSSNRCLWYTISASKSNRHWVSKCIPSTTQATKKRKEKKTNLPHPPKKKTKKKPKPPGLLSSEGKCPLHIPSTCVL